MCEKLLATQGASRAGGKGQGAWAGGRCNRLLWPGQVRWLTVDRLLLAPRIEINLASFQLCATNIHA